MKHALVFVFCIPVNLAGWLVLSLLVLFDFAKRVKPSSAPEDRFRLFAEGYKNGWLHRHWDYSTTLGPHAMYLHPTASSAVVVHELKHTSQAEGVSIAFGLVALASWSWRTALLWPAAWLLAYAGASAAAWLEGRHPYLGNEFEEQAYALQRRLERDVTPEKP